VRRRSMRSVVGSLRSVTLIIVRGDRDEAPVRRYGHHGRSAGPASPALRTAGPAGLAELRTALAGLDPTALAERPIAQRERPPVPGAAVPTAGAPPRPTRTPVGGSPSCRPKAASPRRPAAAAGAATGWTARTTTSWRG
jgi:hypothetical protein